MLTNLATEGVPHCEKKNDGIAIFSSFKNSNFSLQKILLGK